MEGSSGGPNINEEVSIFKVLRQEDCAQAILDLVPIMDLVRSQRVGRQWQGVVHRYLRGCSNLSLHVGTSSPRYDKHSTHRKIKISAVNDKLLLASKIVDKWGPSIVESFIWLDNTQDSFLKSIRSKCPNLRKISMIYIDAKIFNMIKEFKQLKHIWLRNNRCQKNVDNLLGEILQNVNCETIMIDQYISLTGSFLTSINSNNLKSLYLRDCSSLDIMQMVPAVDCLQNITTLQLDNNPISVFMSVYRLFKKLPQLEELSLRGYNLELCGWSTRMRDTSFEYFSELVNLRRLYMENTKYVNDTLLEALARGCKKLEYLDVRGSAGKISVSGLAALCHRSPTARTTLHFGVPENDHDFHQLDIHFSKHCRTIDLYKDLAALGCMELTWEWFSAAARDPRGRELQLNPGAGAVQAGDPQELKIILFADTSEYFLPLEYENDFYRIIP